MSVQEDRSRHPVPCNCEYHRERPVEPRAWVWLPASSSLRRLGRRFVGRG